MLQVPCTLEHNLCTLVVDLRKDIYNSKKVRRNKLVWLLHLFRVLWSEWDQQDHGGECEDETIQPSQCHESHWCLPKCWPCSLYCHALHGQRQSAVLPQKRETKPHSGQNHWWGLGKEYFCLLHYLSHKPSHSLPAISPDNNCSQTFCKFRI